MHTDDSTIGTLGGDVRHLHHLHDPETSADSAAAIDRDEASVVQQVILDLLAEEARPAFALTEVYFERREAEHWPLVHHNSIARRLSELHMQGRVYDTGERLLTTYRRPAAVWAVKVAA